MFYFQIASIILQMSAALNEFQGISLRLKLQSRYKIDKGLFALMTLAKLNVSVLALLE